jgi:hypothetical protein
MRRFKVWIRYVSLRSREYEILEMSDDASDRQCDEACRDCLDTMIANNLKTGWEELP